jgi:disulfide bond formation protein DsbB
MAIFIGALITTTAHYCWANRAGLVSLTLGLGLLALPDAQTILAGWIVPMIIAGIGAGTFIASLRLTLQAAMTDEETPNAVAIYCFLRDTGMTLGVALGEPIF